MKRTSRIPLSAAATVLCALTLAACASERSFREYEEEDEEDPVAEEPPDTGGWGDWELGEVPDVAFALSVMDEATWRTELVVIDLRGRVLDRWQRPMEEMAYPGEIDAIHPLGPGEVMVTIGHGYANTTWGGWHDGLWGGGPSEVWHGDLVRGVWTRRLHADPVTGDYVLDATGETLPVSMWEGLLGVSVVPWGEDPDRLVMSSWNGDCTQGFQQRLLGLDLTGGDDHRLWLTHRDWGDDAGMVWPMSGGLDADGEPAIFARVGTDPCEPGGAWAWTHYARWEVGGPPAQTVIDEADEHLGSVIYDLDDEVSVHARPSDTGEAEFLLDWQGIDVPTTRLPANHARPIAVLDAEHGAALVATQYGTGFHELVIIAGGREVWRIDELQDGLGSRDIQLWTAARVEVP